MEYCRICGLPKEELTNGCCSKCAEQCLLCKECGLFHLPETMAGLNICLKCMLKVADGKVGKDPEGKKQKNVVELLDDICVANRDTPIEDQIGTLKKNDFIEYHRKTFKKTKG